MKQVQIKFRTNLYQDWVTRLSRSILKLFVGESVTNQYHPEKVDQQLFSVFYKKKGGKSINHAQFFLKDTCCSLNKI